MWTRNFFFLAFPAFASQFGCADATTIEPFAAAAAASVSHTANFVGYVYDGAKGSRLSSYDLALQVTDKALPATVAADGRFLTGNIGPFEDYSATIVAEGYRAFVSHNRRVGLPAGNLTDLGSQQTFHFDAFLFPTNLQAAAATFTIKTDVADFKPAGTIRLRPLAPSVLADESEDQPLGVPGQLWSNDEDLQVAVITKEFTAGTFAVAAGELVYGVRYRVDIFGVTGQQPLQATYTAGVENNKTFVLAEEQTDPLTVVSSTGKSCKPPASPDLTSGATFTVTFNYNVEFSEQNYPGGASEALDDGLSITSPDTNGNGTRNKLRQDIVEGVQERFSSLMLSGAQLTVTWNPLAGLVESDSGDSIDAVTYSNLQNIGLRRIGSPSSTRTLQQLLNANSVTCVK